MATSNFGRIWNVASNLSFLETVSYISLGFVLFGATVVVYRLTLHPLAKYPGNFVEKISDWPLILYCMGGERHLRILEAHEKYGEFCLELN
jgi:hypothetical protein